MICAILHSTDVVTPDDAAVDGAGDRAVIYTVLHRAAAVNITDDAAVEVAVGDRAVIYTVLHSAAAVNITDDAAV